MLSLVDIPKGTEFDSFCVELISAATKFSPAKDVLSQRVRFSTIDRRLIPLRVLKF